MIMFQLHLKKIIVAVACIVVVACNSAPEKIIFKNQNYVHTPKSYPAAVTEAEQGNTESAIKLLSKITQHNPDFAPAFTNLGLQLLKSNKHTEAQTALNKASQLNPTNAVAYNHLGVISRINGDFLKARELYQMALEIKPDYINAHLNLGILLDIYLYELDEALQHYVRYQTLSGGSDKAIDKWIIDIQRRIKSEQAKQS